MRHHRITTGLLAAALTLGIAVTPATAAPLNAAPAGPAGTVTAPAFTAAEIAQLRQQILDELLVMDVQENHHAAINAKNLAPWMSAKGWESMDLITDSTSPEVTRLFQAKAKKDGITEAQARANFKKMSTAGDVFSIRFQPSHFTEFGKTKNVLSSGEYKLAKRLPVGSFEVYFFEHVLKEKAGKRHWLILFPPGADKDPQGNTIARHVHYVLGDSPLAILPPMFKQQMATMVEANASWEAKVGLLKFGLAH